MYLCLFNAQVFSFVSLLRDSLWSFHWKIPENSKLKSCECRRTRLVCTRKCQSFMFYFLFFCLKPEVALQYCFRRSFPKIPTLKKDRDSRKHLELQRRKAARKHRPRQGSKGKRKVQSYLVAFDLSFMFFILFVTVLVQFLSEAEASFYAATCFSSSGTSVSER